MLRLAANLLASAAFVGFGLIAAAALSRIGHRWVDILAQFSAPSLAAVFAMLLACLVLRLWPAALVGAGAALLLLLAVWPQWAPPRGRPDTHAPAVRLYSANLWAWNQQTEAIDRSIRSAEADMVILVELGDAPAAQLDRMLAAAGLTDKVFITNTVFWRPPGNRTPSPQEQAACTPFVERTFALLKPKAVLLLGAAAARSVLQTEDGIMKMRGQWREWRLNEGAVSAPAMPTLHPAFLLRQPQAKRQVWADLLALAVRLEGESHLSSGIEGER